ncbi:hypothetical protein [Streptomyces sp. NPDC089919]|uniref:alpha/beta hydrolase family protein n=1 Tax=Streptomyces sp. NPDC089919 TaxID=3155188 RepID=UPI003424C191
MPRPHPAHPGRRALLAAGALLAAAACTPSGTPRASGADRTSETPRTAGAPPVATGRAVVLPAPTGPLPVGTVELHLVDRSRPAPLLPSRPYQEVMAGVWYPADPGREGPVAPWLPAAAAADWDRHSAPGLTVPAGAVDWRGIRTHARTGAPVAGPPADPRTGGRLGRFPVLLFAPGDGGPRALGTALVEELASHGYVVVAVDAPYEADQVEFPGGRVVRALPLPAKLTPATVAALLAEHARARLADARFVLRALGALARGHNPDAAGRDLPAGLAEALDLTRVGAFGQSLGGSVAAALTRAEPRVRAAAGLDGAFVGPVARTGVAVPFLLMLSGAHSLADDPSRRSFWAASTGRRRALRMRGAGHGSYTDLQAILPQLTGLVAAEARAGLIGSVDPERSLAAQRAALTAFFDRYVKGRPGAPFDFDAPGRSGYPVLEAVRYEQAGQSPR